MRVINGRGLMLPILCITKEARQVSKLENQKQISVRTESRRLREQLAKWGQLRAEIEAARLRIRAELRAFGYTPILH